MRPIICEWDGEALRPIRHQRKTAAGQFVVGRRYVMTAVEQRSWASNNHYFAALNEAWLNLPEDQAERFPSADHLRKYALIKCGYADEQSIVCSSHAEALRVAAFVGPIDSYAVVAIDGRVVRRFTAKSQSRSAMGKAEFERSKRAVLDYVAGLIGTTAEQLADHAAPAPQPEFA
jgi:hypothetical protein